MAWTNLITVKHELHRSHVQHEFLAKWQKNFCGGVLIKKLIILEAKPAYTDPKMVTAYMYVHLSDWPTGKNHCGSHNLPIWPTNFALLCGKLVQMQSTDERQLLFCWQFAGKNCRHSHAGKVHTVRLSQTCVFFPALLAAFFPKHNYTQWLISSFPQNGYAFSIWKWSCEANV